LSYGTGSKSFLGPSSSRNYQLPPIQAPFYFPGNRGQLSGYSDGGDLTGVWQLSLDKLPPNGIVSISMLTEGVPKDFATYCLEYTFAKLSPYFLEIQPAPLFGTFKSMKQ
jgi:hypothetical protein